jgi:hypothetical protein
MERRRLVGVAGGEVLQGLLLAVLDDLEIVSREPRDGLSLFVDDHHTEVHEIDRRAEGRLLRLPGRHGSRQAHDDNGREYPLHPLHLAHASHLAHPAHPSHLAR